MEEAEGSDADYDMTSPQDPITLPTPIAPVQGTAVAPNQDLLRNILAQSSQAQPQEKDIELGSVMTVSSLMTLLEDGDVAERLYSSLPDGTCL